MSDYLGRISLDAKLHSPRGLEFQVLDGRTRQVIHHLPFLGVLLHIKQHLCRRMLEHELLGADVLGAHQLDAEVRHGLAPQDHLVGQVHRRDVELDWYMYVMHRMLYPQHYEASIVQDIIAACGHEHALALSSANGAIWHEERLRRKQGCIRGDFTLIFDYFQVILALTLIFCYFQVILAHILHRSTQREVTVDHLDQAVRL